MMTTQKNGDGFFDDGRVWEYLFQESNVQHSQPRVDSTKMPHHQQRPWQHAQSPASSSDTPPPCLTDNAVQKLRPRQKSQSLLPCRCPFPGCGKELSKRSNLKAHQRVHFDVHPYECPYPNCDKRFRWKSSLKPHIKVHQHGRSKRRRSNAAHNGNGIAKKNTRKYYQCPRPGCGAKVERISILEKHELRTHYDEPDCGKLAPKVVTYFSEPLCVATLPRLGLSENELKSRYTSSSQLEPTSSPVSIMTSWDANSSEEDENCTLQSTALIGQKKQESWNDIDMQVMSDVDALDSLMLDIPEQGSHDHAQNAQARAAAQNGVPQDSMQNFYYAL